MVPGRPLCTMHVSLMWVLVCVLTLQLRALCHNACAMAHTGKVVRYRWVHL